MTQQASPLDHFAVRLAALAVIIIVAVLPGEHHRGGASSRAAQHAAPVAQGSSIRFDGGPEEGTRGSLERQAELEPAKIG